MENFPFSKRLVRELYKKKEREAAEAQDAGDLLKFAKLAKQCLHLSLIAEKLEDANFAGAQIARYSKDTRPLTAQERELAEALKYPGLGTKQTDEFEGDRDQAGDSQKLQSRYLH